MVGMTSDDAAAGAPEELLRKRSDHAALGYVLLECLKESSYLQIVRENGEWIVSTSSDGHLNTRDKNLNMALLKNVLEQIAEKRDLDE